MSPQEMSKQAIVPQNNGLVFSPIKGAGLVSTLTAARILFPDEGVSKTILRRVQRLCKLNQLESYKLGHSYKIVKQSVYDYIEENHYPMVRRLNFQ